MNIKDRKLLMENRMRSTNGQNPENLLEKYATRLLALLIAVLCFALFYFGPKIAPVYKDVFVSFSTSLFASLLFAIFYSIIVERHHMNAINKELVDNIEIVVDEMKHHQEVNMLRITDSTILKIEEIEKSYYHEISIHFRELIPFDYFPPVPYGQSDKRFTEVLNTALVKSRQYLFKGVAGRYVPGRLAEMGGHLKTCKMLLIDPEQEDLLWLYIRDRYKVSLSREEVVEQVNKVKQEIYLTVVDLFELAPIMPIYIGIFNGPIFYRTEIFDELVLVSYFTTKTSATTYPVTYLYNRDSFYYNAYMTDFNQTSELAAKSTIFNSKSTEKDLNNFLERIGYQPDKIEQLRIEAERLRLQFLKKK